MINSIELKNFKCHKNDTFNLSNLTLLSGSNGAGKSTIIQSILLLRKNFEHGYLTGPDKYASLNFPGLSLGFGSDILYRKYNDKEISITIKENQNEYQWKWAAESQLDYLKPLPPIPQDVDTCGLFSKNFSYLTAHRISPQMYYPNSRHAVFENNNVGHEGEYTANFLAENASNPIPIPELKHPLATGTTLGEQVNLWLDDISAGFRVQSQVDNHTNTSRLVFLDTSDADLISEYKAPNVGFGLTNVLPLFVVLLSARPGDLVIIENPENHLHPNAQLVVSQLIAMAANKEVQVLVETHSDHILNGTRIAIKENYIESTKVKIWHFIRPKNSEPEISEIIIDGEGKITTWPTGFFDDYERALLKLV